MTKPTTTARVTFTELKRYALPLVTAHIRLALSYDVVSVKIAFEFQITRPLLNWTVTLMTENLEELIVRLEQQPVVTFDEEQDRLLVTCGTGELEQYNRYERVGWWKGL